jgi:hypothetical protein
MDLETVTLIIEAVGAAGVIASLVFLGFETRKNTKTMRASLSNETLTGVAVLNDAIAGSPELRSVASKMQNPNLLVVDFSTEELDIVIYLARALFLRFEGIYILYKQGLADEELWFQRRAAGAGMLQIPVLKHYWEQEQSNSVYTPGFTAELNSAAAADLRPPISTKAD